MMKLSNDISILAVALTIQKLHSSEKYFCKSPKAYGKASNETATFRSWGEWSTSVLPTTAVAHVVIGIKGDLKVNKLFGE